MTHITERDLEMRAKLQALIDEKDAARGRPLTAVEQMANLRWHLTHCDKCEGEIKGTEAFCPHCDYELFM